MATVNKNFKIKQGLVVEGTTGTINGVNILTENQASEDYIVGIVGGTTLVTSVESTQMEVTAGELNIKSGVFDVSGAAAAAQSAAVSTASADATSKANAAKTAAEATASADATSKANAAKTAAEATASADATSKANAAQAAAIAAAALDATSKANGAETDAIAAAAADATTKANNAKSGAEATAAAALSTAISTEVTDRNAAISSAIATEVTDRNSAIGTAVSNLVDGAPGLLDTLNELATALGNDANFATTVATSIGTKQAQLNGTGFVKVTGTTVSYDNATYLTTGTAGTTYLPLAGGTLTVSRSNGTNVNVLILADNLTGVSTPGYGTRIVGYSNGNSVQSVIGFENGGTGTNNESQLSFYTQNVAGSLTRQLLITSTGVANFSNRIEIISNGGTNPVLAIRQTNAATQGYDFETEDVSVGRLDLYGKTVSGRVHMMSWIKATGNVGIGTLSPYSNAKLQVRTGTNINLAFQTGTTDSSGIKLNAFNDYFAQMRIKLEIDAVKIIETSFLLYNTQKIKRMEK